MHRIIKLSKKYQTKFFRKLILIRGSVLKNQINAYWFNKVPNFGDQLAPALLCYYGFTPIHSSKANATIVSLGSILDNLPLEYSGLILGAGFKNDIERKFPCANILAVRGELTRDRLGLSEKAILGDPGLLADRLLSRRQKKHYKVGIVPHFFDKDNEIIKMIKTNNYTTINIIDVQKRPKEVIKEIDRCEYVLSSSLHGMIVADSLGIPNAWLVLSDKVQGRGFKFYDYFSSFKESYDPVFLTGKEEISDLICYTHLPSEKLFDVKDKLSFLYKQLKHILTNKEF